MTIGQRKSVPRPDEGWAWVVASSCFLINFIMAGLARSAGVLYVALLEGYGVSREEATTPFSVRVSIRNMTGPLVGILGQKYGIQRVTICGGVLAGIGGILCFFAPNVFWITIFWGVIHGFGFGLSTVLHMMTVNQYFDKYKATALGFGYSGDCIGTFVQPVLLEFLLSIYGVRGTFLIVGAFVLNVVPLAMLLVPPPWLNMLSNTQKFKPDVAKNKTDMTTKSILAHAYENKAFATSENSNNGNAEMMSVSCKDQNNIPSYEQVIGTINNNQRVILSPTETVTDIDVDISKKDTEHEANGFDRNGIEIAQAENQMIPEFLTIEEERPIRTSSVCMDAYLPPPEIINCCYKTSQSDASIKQQDNYTEIIVENINQIKSMTATITEQCGKGKETVIRIRALSETVKDGKFLDVNKSAIYGRSLSLCRGKKKKETEICPDNGQLKLTSIQTATRIEKEFEIPESDIEMNAMKSCIKICYEKDDSSDKPPSIQLGHLQAVVPKTEVMLDKDNIQIVPTRNDSGMKSILKHAMKANMKPMFVLISLTMAAYVLLFISIMTVIIDFGQDKGVSAEMGKYLVISFSAADLVGRLGFGVVIDRQWIQMHHYAALFVSLMGVSVALIPFGKGIYFLATGMAIYGFIQGGVAIMYPILIIKYMEKDEEAIGMGCLNFYAGVLMLAVAPMIGFFRDTIGSYDDMFYIVGLVTLAAGVTWFFEPFIFGLQKRLMEKSKIRVNISCEKSDKIRTSENATSK